MSRLRIVHALALCGICGLFTGMAGGCDPQATLPEMIRGDWQAPILHRTEARSESVVAMEFDEPVHLLELSIDPVVEITESRWWDGALELTGRPAFLPGREYWIDARVADESGNVSSILASVYGLNEHVPDIRISEFVCEGSAAHPDWIELEVLTDGNVGGMCLYEGSPGSWDSRVILPPLDVGGGDYIVVHCKPEGLPEEVDELTTPSESGGNDASPAAWDVWVPEGDGIPNSTGAITLCSYPRGPIVDAVLYTTKKYDVSSDKRGFGLTSQLAMFEEVVALGGWEITGEFVIPEDGVDPENSTATRSICRTPGAPDTGTAADWHITPTGGASPGSQNSPDRYSP